jgi:NADH dehydrogenase FAD-containing subunit
LAANADQFTFNDKKRLVLDEYLGAGDDVFVIGDNAPTQFGGMAQTALHNAVYMAEHLKRLVSGKPVKAYQPKEPIYATPVGANWAAIQWGKRRYYGLTGWWLRRAADLVGYRDLLPEITAWTLWLGGGRKSEDCPVCRGEVSAEPTQA